MRHWQWLPRASSSLPARSCCVHRESPQPDSGCGLQETASSRPEAWHLVPAMLVAILGGNKRLCLVTSYLKQLPTIREEFPL